MPEKNKSTAKSARSAAGKNKKSQQKKQSPARNPENAFLPQLIPLFLILAAVLAAVCVIVDQGVVCKAIRRVLTGLLGIAAYILPLVLLVRAIFLNRDREEGRSASRTVCAAAALLLFAMVMHIFGGGPDSFGASEHYAAGSEGMIPSGGGVLGGVLGQLMLRGFGRVFSAIVLFSALLFLCLYICGISPRGVALWIAYHADRIAESAREKREAARDKRMNADPTRNQMREEEYLRYLRDKKERARLKKAQGVPDGGVPVPANVPMPAAMPADGEVTGKKKRKAPVQDPMADQIPMEDAPKRREVYHVRRRRLSELDIPVSGPADPGAARDDLPISIQPPQPGTDAYKKDPDTGWAADAFRDPSDLSDPVRNELASPDADSEAVDEKIFDEVLQRTKKKMSGRQRTEGNARPAAKVQTVVSGGIPIPDGMTGAPFSGSGRPPAGTPVPAATVPATPVPATPEPEKDPLPVPGMPDDLSADPISEPAPDPTAGAGIEAVKHSVEQAVGSDIIFNT